MWRALAVPRDLPAAGPLHNAAPPFFALCRRLALAALTGRTLVLPQAARLEHMGRTSDHNCCYNDSQVYDLAAMRAVVDVITSSEFSRLEGCTPIELPPSKSFAQHYSGGLSGSTSALRREL